MLAQKAVEKGMEQLGGRASARVILTLALVLALDGADKGAVGAMARQLEHAFHIGKPEIGLLLTVSSLVNGLATIPFGWLVDRTRRTLLLAIAILLWGVAMAVMASSTSYLYLLLSRLGLGVVTAVATPATASLIGDFFPSHRRGRIYGYVLSGEFIGIGIGFIGAGELAVISWRFGFLGLAVPALLLAWAVKRLPEPSRGGQGQLRAGQEKIEPSTRDRSLPSKGTSGEDPSTRLVREKMRQADVTPRENLVLDTDPQNKSLWWAVGYVLRIPSNIVLIIASALGYYLFAGVRTFGVEYFTGKYHLGHSAALWLLCLLGVGSVLGVFVGGRLGDWLLRRGHLAGRVSVAIVGYFLAGVLFIPGLLSSSLPLAMIPFFFAAAALGCVNAPLDAARLDIMHPHLWGRAEAVRMMFRQIAEAVAPLLFGFIAARLFGGGAAGLQWTFLLMLIPLFVGGFIALFAFSTYPRDVATAEAYLQRTKEREKNEHATRKSA